MPKRNKKINEEDKNIAVSNPDTVNEELNTETEIMQTEPALNALPSEPEFAEDNESVNANIETKTSDDEPETDVQEDNFAHEKSEVVENAIPEKEWCVQATAETVVLRNNVSILLSPGKIFTGKLAKYLFDQKAPVIEI